MPVTTVDENTNSSSGSAGHAAGQDAPLVTTAALQTDAPAGSPLGARSYLSDLLLAKIDQYRLWIVLAILGLYALAFNVNWRLEPDSALYLSIGRNLAEGQGYTYHGKDHRLAYPGVPLLFGGAFKVFGTASLLPHIVIMWLMGLATLGLTYRLFLLYSNRPTALLITLGVAISRVYFRYTFELLSDLPFLFGVMAFFVGYESIFHRRADTEISRKRWYLTIRWYDALLLIGGLAFAVAARPAMLALVAAAAFAMLWSLVRGRWSWGHIAIVLLVVGVVALFYLKDPRQQKQDPNSASSTITYAEEDQLFHLQRERLAIMLETARKNIPGVFEHAVTKASFGGSIVPGLNTLLAVVITAAGISLVRYRPLWGMWVLATLLMVMLVPKPVERYFLPVLPILVFAWWSLTRWAERRVKPKWSIPTFLVLFGLGGVSNFLGTAAFIYEQRQMPFLTSYKKGRYASVYEVATAIQNRTPPSGDPRDDRNTWICVPDKFARILTFLSRRYCIEPEVYSPLQPAKAPNIYVLAPTEALQPDAEQRRQPLQQWLSQRGAMISPQTLGSAIANKDPDDPRPWTLHRAVPIPPAPPATASPAAPASAPSAQGVSR